MVSYFFIKQNNSRRLPTVKNGHNVKMCREKQNVVYKTRNGGGSPLSAIGHQLFSSIQMVSKRIYNKMRSIHLQKLQTEKFSVHVDLRKECSSNTYQPSRVGEPLLYTTARQINFE